MTTRASWSEALERRFGRKQGLLRHTAARLAGALGAWRSYAALEVSRVQRMVFVCQGNICRSAYAEARARALGLTAASFGLAALSGARADPRAQRAAARRGLDLSSHVARAPFEVPLVDGDLVLAMEPRHAIALHGALPEGAQLGLLGLFAPEPRPHLEDPFGLCDAYFDTCFGLIDAALDELLRRRT